MGQCLTRAILRQPLGQIVYPLPAQTAMSNPTLPPELFDHVIDLLHHQRETLKQCCLVSKSWIPRTRVYLFAEIAFRDIVELGRWRNIFPNPANSPGYYTRSLSLHSTNRSIVAIVAEGDGWIRGFPYVVQLKLEHSTKNIHFHYFSIHSLTLESSCADGYPFPPLNRQVLTLVCSFPHLEDVNLVGFEVTNGGDDNISFQPPTSPPFTGTLTLDWPRKMEWLFPRLFNLPNGIRFRKLKCSLGRVEDIRWATALVEVCSNTLEHVDIESPLSCLRRSPPFGCDNSPWLELTSGPGGSSATSINFSKATKLKEMVFRFDDRSAGWVTMALKTITPEHGDLRQVSIHFTSNSFDIQSIFPLNVSQYIGDEASMYWMDLNRLLVQLHESRAVCLMARFRSSSDPVDKRRYVAALLPGVTKGGMARVVYDTKRR